MHDNVIYYGCIFVSLTDLFFWFNLAGVTYDLLWKTIVKGEWKGVRKIIEHHPDARTACITPYGETALHIAASCGHVEIVKELAKLLPPQDLATKSLNDVTALSWAAIGGFTKIAEFLVRKNPQLLSIPCDPGYIPVVMASMAGHKDTVRFLYYKTRLDDLLQDRSKNGAALFFNCITGEIYDIALHLLKRCPELAKSVDFEGKSALHLLAQKPSAFRSGSIRVQPPCLSRLHGDIDDRGNWIKEVPAIQHICDEMDKHLQAYELLRCISQEISSSGEPQLTTVGAQKALFEAVRHGISEVFIEILKYFPNTIWLKDELERGIFSQAILERQERIFSLLSTLIGARKQILAEVLDPENNNILHHAAILPSSSRLDRISGAALQMQRELQWFKEVENIVQPKYREMVNKIGKTPREIFTQQHKKLAEQGEKWMKDTAAACTVVAAIITTIMFAAAFTVPGGFEDKTGIPTYLHRNSFIVFVVSDASSLLTSSISILVFLGILTSRYKEEDFLKSLPAKLIIGLSTLFFSMATMMITFGTALVIVLRDRVSWIPIPIILLASIPVTFFGLLQFPLLVEIFISTYGHGNFDRLKK
ncbi:hypothetical protein F0562_030836 [Nyssa sinensis]|uniref:PGG domain-containing protein n=1 Tax=Nyssa sinensis TaxID=561372 RepID=A0A5J5AZJ3_9ASTE|nr:hypothetical protein F0562_030836 [Nyssa sinensis]